MKIVQYFVLLIFLLVGCVPRGTEVPVDVRRFQVFKGDSLLSLGRYWEALPYFRHAWALSETDEERWEVDSRLYQVFFSSRDWDSCVVQAEALRETPYFDSLQYKGLVYWRAGQFEEILHISDASPLLRAEAALRVGLEDSARVLYLRAQKLLGEVATGRLAEVYADLGYSDSAEVLLGRLKHPSNSQSRLYVEVLFEREAWSDLPGAIARLPLESERLAALVRLYDAVGDTKKRRRTQMKLIEKFPSSWAARQAAREVTPQGAAEHFLVAKAYAGIDGDKAIELFNQAQSLGYSRSRCRQERGRIYCRQKKYRQAYNELAGLSAVEAQFLYVKAALKLGYESEALEVLADVARNASRKTDRQEAWERQATVLQQEGKNAEAAELAAEGSRVLKDEELGHRALVLWLVEGDTASARSALAGNVPLDSDISLFFRIWLFPDSADTILSDLSTHDPFSYYTLMARGDVLPQPSLHEWFEELDDTSHTLSSQDSIIEHQAFALAEAGFFSDASSKLRAIKDPPLPKMYEWGRYFSDLGADNVAIHWMEMLLSKARKKGVRTRPYEILKLQYPAVYVLQIERAVDDEALFMALTRQESWFNPGAKSSANAYGLCQLLLSTARGIDTTVTVDSLYDADVSIRIGAEFFRRMRVRFDERKTAYLGAYNAGPGAVERWLIYLPADDVLYTELIVYDETRLYVKQISRGEIIYRSLLGLE